MMYRAVFFFNNLLSLLAGWCLYYTLSHVLRHANGLGVLAVSSHGGIISSGSHRIDNPFSARIVTNVHDFHSETSAPVRPSATWSRRYDSGEQKILQGIDRRRCLSSKDINVITSSWNFLKRRLSDFAPKVFLRYFQTRPGARKMFPAFANVKIAELSTNRDFLSAAYNCVASLTYVIPHLKCDLLERCPAFNKLKKKDNIVAIKRFGSIWVNTIHEEMANNTSNNEVLRDAWKKAFLPLRKYATA